MGIEIPTTVFYSFNPLLVVIFTPIYLYLSKSYCNTVHPRSWFIRIGNGFVFLGMSFVCLAFSIMNQSSLLSPWWVIGAIILQTIGEILIVPNLFSTISKNAPPRLKNTIMGLMLMALAYSHFISGLIAQFSVTDTLTIMAQQEAYILFFTCLSLIPLIVGALFFCSRKSSWGATIHG